MTENILNSDSIVMGQQQLNKTVLVITYLIQEKRKNKEMRDASWGNKTKQAKRANK